MAKAAGEIAPLLDRAPQGRIEDGLPVTMAWIRRHDQYEHTTGPTVTS